MNGQCREWDSNPHGVAPKWIVSPYKTPGRYRFSGLSGGGGLSLGHSDQPADLQCPFDFDTSAGQPPERLGSAHEISRVVFLIWHLLQRA